MRKNQTKIFVAIEEEIEDTKILGADLSLKEAWERHFNLPNTHITRRIVVEMPIGCPTNYVRYDDRHGYKTHENHRSKSN